MTSVPKPSELPIQHLENTFHSCAFAKAESFLETAVPVKLIIQGGGECGQHQFHTYSARKEMPPCI